MNHIRRAVDMLGGGEKIIVAVIALDDGRVGRILGDNGILVFGRLKMSYRTDCEQHQHCEKSFTHSICLIPNIQYKNEPLGAVFLVVRGRFSAFCYTNIGILFHFRYFFLIFLLLFLSIGEKISIFAQRFG